MCHLLYILCIVQYIWHIFTVLHNTASYASHHSPRIALSVCSYYTIFNHLTRTPIHLMWAWALDINYLLSHQQTSKDSSPHKHTISISSVRYKMTIDLVLVTCRSNNLDSSKDQIFEISEIRTEPWERNEWTSFKEEEKFLLVLITQQEFVFIKCAEMVFGCCHIARLSILQITSWVAQSSLVVGCLSRTGNIST